MKDHILFDLNWLILFIELNESPWCALILSDSIIYIDGCDMIHSVKLLLYLFLFEFWTGQFYRCNSIRMIWLSQFHWLICSIIKLNVWIDVIYFIWYNYRGSVIGWSELKQSIRFQLIYLNKRAFWSHLDGLIWPNWWYIDSIWCRSGVAVTCAYLPSPRRATTAWKWRRNSSSSSISCASMQRFEYWWAFSHYFTSKNIFFYLFIQENQQN